MLGEIFRLTPTTSHTDGYILILKANATQRFRTELLGLPHVFTIVEDLGSRLVLTANPLFEADEIKAAIAPLVDNLMADE